ncbi:hypothetical protein [Bacillus sp. FJAT-42376]|nr:hypothetical protein [Bacillus sp. FJAT-42376]
MRRRAKQEEIEKVIGYMGSSRFLLADGLVSAGLIALFLYLFH